MLILRGCCGVERRELLAILVGSAVGWPLAARAQQKTMPVIGFLSGASPGPYQSNVAAFHQGLADVLSVEC